MVSQKARQEMIAPTPLERSICTNELRWVVNPRGTRFPKVLQQKFTVHDLRSTSAKPVEEWRDVPMAAGDDADE